MTNPEAKIHLEQSAVKACDLENAFRQKGISSGMIDVIRSFCQILHGRQSPMPGISLCLPFINYVKISNLSILILYGREDNRKHNNSSLQHHLRIRGNI